MYETPKEYYRRIHHIRPRFKGDLENVFFFMANEISGISPLEKKEFDKKLENALRLFPGNQKKADKTISNWRTEISSLFGFIVYEDVDDKTIGRPSNVGKRLAEKQDLVEFFKFFLYTFQYPGGHLKPRESKALVEDGVRFKPARYILKLLKTADNHEDRFGMNKAEATHCIFNDLRVTRDHRPVEEVIALIKENRNQDVEYNWKGDVIRYAGDILDYMVTANLLVKHGKKYYLNRNSMRDILYFVKEDQWFGGYEGLSREEEMDVYREIRRDWFRYLDNVSTQIEFETDILEYLDLDKEQYEDLIQLEDLKETRLEGLLDKIEGPESVKTKEIGDTGEALVQGHECMKLRHAGLIDLIEKVANIPDRLGLGYDIRSFDENSEEIEIEVKSTVSSSEINFNTFHLTENEWNKADQDGDRYFVYRLMISKNGIRLSIIQNPVQKYKNDLLDMRLNNGPQTKFRKEASQEEDLLIWEEKV